MRRPGTFVGLCCLVAVVSACEGGPPLAPETEDVVGPRPQLLANARALSSRPVGDPRIPDGAVRLNVVEFCFFGRTTFPAGVPFWVQHGFFVSGADPDPDQISQLMSPETRFVLRVDGEDRFQFMVVERGDDRLSKTFLSVFHEGLEGEHLFEAVWTLEGLGAVQRCTFSVSFTPPDPGEGV